MISNFPYIQTRAGKKVVPFISNFSSVQFIKHDTGILKDQADHFISVNIINL